ncbi:HEAT repeat domain-containing protein [Prochlorococcus sp. MIT 1307]|uniref:HEAT repeat domain-containing protein n=1 Tax=Prochlorococcus sp. MIT 1307 TaxID=3096219 RepID=UPI002A7557E4|nr:HEAT repeat domain-containing protein [Prochlorococcus sp. MIT 1307]
MSKKTHFQQSSEEIVLGEDEASKLADELKSELQRGSIPTADEKRIQLIIAGLGDRRGLLRRTFAESLGAIGKSTVPALRKALIQHSNVTVRRAAAKALKLVGDPSALPDLLLALINDKDPVVQGSSVAAMAIFGESAVEYLLAVLVNSNSTTTQCGLASWGLSFIGAEAPKALRKAAQSKNAVVKAAAISALGEQIQLLGDKSAKNLVVNALEDPAIEVRAAATTLMGKLDDPLWARPLLIKRLADPNPGVRKNAALSLMKLKASDAINELKKIYRTEKDAEVSPVLKLVINNLSKG